MHSASRAQVIARTWLNYTPVRLNLSSCAIEALKWIALAFMLIDHVNRIFFENKILFMEAIGRSALPLFGFVLAYNLARPGVLKHGVYRRIVSRLFVFGVLAVPFYMLCFRNAYAWWPLNVLFLLLCFVGIVWIIELKNNYQFFAFTLFIVGGALVEYWWAGLIYCLAAWLFCKKQNAVSLLFWVMGTVCLFFVNGNLWALLVFPIIFISQYSSIKLPRYKYLFYVFYPAHMAILFACKQIFTH